MPNAGQEHQLERLSQEAAERYQAPAAPAWERMEQVLDREIPVAKRRRRRFLFWWLLPVALGSAWLGYRQWSGAGTAAQAAKQSVQASPSLHTATAATPKPTDGPAGNANPDAASPSVAASPRMAMVARGTTALSGKVASFSNKRTAASTTVADSKTTINTAATTVNSKTGSADNSTTTTVSLASEAPRAADPLLQTGITQENKTIPTANTTLTAVTDTLPAHTNHTDSSQIPAPVKTTRTLAPRGKGFSFGLIAGLDQSTVKFKYGERMGYTIGLGIGYHFNDHWSLHTGTMYTQKNYKMDGADFHAPKGSWLNNYKLETVDGYCRMWEFPLTMRYSSGKFFTAAGLSSYLMQQEQYNYFYYYNNNPVTRKATYNTSSTYLFSVVSLSAGFEQRISSSISLLAEPYAKLPLLGLGHGSAKLSSFGLNFFVQYRQPAKKQMRTRE